MNVSDYLSGLPEKFPVSVNVTTRTGEQLKRSAVARVTEPPGLELRFSANALPPADGLDMAADCLVFIETGEIVTLICSAEKTEARNRLLVTVREVIQHVEKREFFRGPAGRLSVSCRQKGPGGDAGFTAQGVNISCGGMLLMTARRLRQKETLAVDIYVPDPVKKRIRCDAVVLRVSRIRENVFFTAVRFVNLDSANCDDIMAFCFAEQRRLLREQVITRDI